MERLFLDTARMGQPRTAAINAVTALSHYWQLNGLSAEFDQFLHEGFEGNRFRQFPALGTWHGISELKTRLLRCAGFATDWNVLIANRSSKLFELSTRVLGRKCRRAMCIQSLWPSYRKTLTGCIETVIFDDTRAYTDSRLVNDALDYFEVTRCDAVVLPTISHFGKAFPYSEIIAHLMASTRINLVVLDGAQEFGHTPIQPLSKAPVIYLTCTQKWLRSGLTAGVGFVSPEVGWQEVMQGVNQIDDPLLHFDCGSARDELFGETVSVMALIACRAAIEGLDPKRIRSKHEIRRINRENLKVILTIRGNTDFETSTTGMLTFSPGEEASRQTTELRRKFLDLGIVLSAFPGGLVRLSMPETKLSDEQLEWIEGTFNRVAENKPYSPSRISYCRA